MKLNDPIATWLPELRDVKVETRKTDKDGTVAVEVIVADFINYAKNRGIPVGPGRGSAAGSLVAYVTAITDLGSH